MKHKRQQAKVSFGIRPLRQLAGKALLGFFGCMHVLITAEAQQVPDYNLYTLDASLLNPAAVGLQDYSHVHLLYRKQWVGLTGTPEIARLSIQGPLPNRPMGLGGFVLSDSYHLLQKNVAGLQYAYRIDLAQESHLRMGLQASLAQHLFRFDKVVAESPGDEVLFQYPEQNNAFDLAVGLLYQRRKWTLGFSSLQLLQNDLTLLSQENKKELRYKLVRHFNLSASYKFHLPDPRISLEPSLLLRNVQGLPATLDMNVQALFEDRLWAGLSYRNLSSVAVHFGMLASERFGFTYAFEHGFNELSYASNGSHELRLSYRLASTSAAGGASYARRDVESLSRQTTEQYEMIDRLRYQTEESKEAIAQQNSAIEQLREDVKGNQEEIDDIIQQLQASPAGAYTPRGELSSEEMESESAPEGSKYYVIVGAFKSLKYAKVFQNIFRRETGNETTVVQSRMVNSSYYYLVSSTATDSFEEALEEMKKMRKSEANKLITGEPWIYIER